MPKGLCGDAPQCGTFLVHFSEAGRSCLPLWSRGAVFVCIRGWSGSRGMVRLKKQRGLLLFLSPFACLLAVNLIREEKYTFCFDKAGLCFHTESELSTVLEIVSSILKHFQTVIAPVSFPANCLASFFLLCLFHPSSDDKGLRFLLGLQCGCRACHRQRISGPR